MPKKTVEFVEHSLQLQLKMGGEREGEQGGSKGGGNPCERPSHCLSTGRGV